MSLLKWWFSLSGAALALLFCYAYVPVVIPIVAIFVLLGGVTTVIVFLARALERRIGRMPEQE